VKIIALCTALTSSYFLVSVAAAQVTTQPQNSAATSAQPGIPPPAPPPIVGAVALPADCVQVKQVDAVSAGHDFSRDTGGEGPVNAQLSLTLVLDRSKNWSVKCGLSNKANPDEYVNFVSKTPQVRVWTATESQTQFDFLRAEVKSTIETAVTEKLVQSTLVQDAVSRAVQDQAMVQNAIKQALSDAIDEAIRAKLPQIEADVKKHLEQDVKDKSKTAASTNPQ
jgi:hypothetical protein